MSHRPNTPPPPVNLVSSNQYNAVLARLDAEVHTRAQLEADLAVARDELAHLRHRLAAVLPLPTTNLTHPAAAATVAASAAAAASVSVPSLQDRPVPMNDEPPAHHSRYLAAPIPQHSHHPQHPHHRKDEPVPVAASTDPKGHDKEILSHCSDISGSKSGLPTQDSAPMKKSAQRKSSNNLVNMAGVSKKQTKSKKERPSKVKIPGQSRYWTPEEHKLFLEALNKYGHKDLRAISSYVGTRNMTQVRTHSQKYFMRLMREAKRQNPVGTKSAHASGDETSPSEDVTVATSTASIPPRPPANNSGALQPRDSSTGATGEDAVKEVDTSDKYSVPNTCGMTLLCLVGQDTLPV